MTHPHLELRDLSGDRVDLPLDLLLPLLCLEAASAVAGAVRGQFVELREQAVSLLLEQQELAVYFLSLLGMLVETLVGGQGQRLVFCSLLNDGE